MSSRPGQRLAAPLRLAWKSLRLHKRRFVGTVLAVFLGTSFLAGTLILGDTLRGSFDSLFATSNTGTDAVVRSADVITAGNAAAAREPVPTSLVEKIRGVDGVAAAAPSVQGQGQLLDADGKPVGKSMGPPPLAGNWITDAQLNPYDLADGRAPERAGEVVVNRGAATAGGLKVGDKAMLRTPDPLHVKVVGIATFGGADGMGQQVFTAMTLDEAQRHLMPKPGQAASISVRAEDGVSQQELTDRIAPVLPKGAEALTGTEATEESQEMISGRFLDLFTTLLTVFAGIALLVATFSIHNTFAIVVSQRTRDNALLRALGASRQQVLGSTLIEATVVSLAASVAGVAGGLGMAKGLYALFTAVGMGLPPGGLVVSWLSLLLPVAVGVAVSVGSALLPALHAGRTAPLAVLRETATDPSGASRARTVLGALAAVVGVGLAVYGALSPDVWLGGTGAVLLLVSFIVLGPVASALAVRVMGAPLSRLRGITGGLARRNARRNPKRTAATATALMIGVTVVTLFTVFASSLQATMDETVSRSFAGDVAVSTSSAGAAQRGAGGGVSPQLAPKLAALDEVDTAVGLGKGVAKVDGAGRQLTVTDPEQAAAVLELGAVDGSFAGLGRDELAVSRTEADKRDMKVGSVLRLTFTDGKHEDFTVGAVYGETELAGDYVLTREAWAPHRGQDADSLVAVVFRDGIDPATAGKTAVEDAAAPYGSLQVNTREEYADSAAEGMSMMLTLVYAMLALAVLIALFGITNTLTLAIHERTRELGLLRAVGALRAQLRSLVRWESVLVAAFGAMGGLLLGGVLGWVLVRASDAEGTSVFAVPWLRVGLILAVGVLAGVLAGLRPARQAARLNVLRALSHA
ncbi:ABC transporter permease [Streptomyces sp. NPDC002851]